MYSDKKNSTWLAAQFIITLLFSLLSLKINIINFGSSIFGVWIVLSSLWGFGSAIDFGFGTAIIKYVAQYKDRNEDVDRILSSVFFVFIILGVMIFVLCTVIAYLFYFSQSFILSEHLEYFKRIFLILGFSFFIQYISIFFKSILEGLNRFNVTSFALIAQNTLIVVGVILIYLLKLGIIWLSYLYLTVSTIVLIFYLSYHGLRIKKYRIKLALFNYSEAKRIFLYSFSIQLMNIFSAMIDPAVKYLIGNYYSMNSIPAYEIARRFALAISGLFFNSFRIILPKASALKNDGEIDNFVKSAVLKYSKIGITYSGATFGILLFPIIIIMNYVFGIRESIVMFVILALPESINNFGYGIYNFLLGIGRVKILILIQFNNLIFMIAGLFIGFKLFNNPFGLLGYFVSVIIANIIMIFYLEKNWKVTLSEIISGSKLNKLLALLLAMGIVSIIFYNNIISSYILFPLMSLSMFILFAGDIRELLSQIMVGNKLKSAQIK